MELPPDDSSRSFRLLPKALAERVSAFQRDLRAVVNDLRGVRAPPFSARAVAPEVKNSATANGAQGLLASRTLEVVEVIRETHDTISLRLSDPTGRAIDFVPGQFLTLQLVIGGETVRRAYSISSTPGEPTVTVTIKRVPGGVASNHFNDHAHAMMKIQVLGPSGSFTVAPAGERARRLVLVAGGSGVTPIMSIARTVLAREPDAVVALIDGNRSVDDLIFADGIAALAAEHPKRFVVRHVLAKESGRGFEHAVGILDPATTSKVVDSIDAELAAAADYFVCGPELMMSAVRESLVARGIPADRIHEERFTATHHKPLTTTATEQSITIRIAGRELTTTASPGQTVLEAGLAAGVAMPFSCAMGGCGACRVKLVSGDVDLDEPNCLTPAERKGGFVLACSSRAIKPIVVEVPAEGAR
ncbi:MAG: 2Fe-2S iron-sulfur cluster-binding protein [Polyangiales bacterium]